MNGSSGAYPFDGVILNFSQTPLGDKDFNQMYRLAEAKGLPMKRVQLYQFDLSSVDLGADVAAQVITIIENYLADEHDGAQRAAALLSQGTYLVILPESAEVAATLMSLIVGMRSLFPTVVQFDANGQIVALVGTHSVALVGMKVSGDYNGPAEKTRRTAKKTGWWQRLVKSVVSKL